MAQLEQRAPASKIDLGLDRVRVIYQRLFPDPAWPNSKIITIAGTNGKGSTVAFCESIALMHGKTTAAYISPHIHQFNERLRFNSEPLSDDQWLEALICVDDVRGDTHLTWFEHVTLAAMWLTQQQAPEVVILEVGLGGRLDAVNIIDPDVAILTSIGLDHMDYLGPTRLDIGREKLGIARAQRPLIITERNLPLGLDAVITALDAQTQCIGQDFDWHASPLKSESVWQLECTSPTKRQWALPRPRLVGDYQLSNASAAILALQAIWPDDLDPDCIGQGLIQAHLPGRFETVAGPPASPEVILDVAHNPQAAQVLATNLMAQPAKGQTWAVFGALRDKDVEAIGQALAQPIDRWLVGDLSGPRGQTSAAVAKRLQSQGITAPIEAVKSITAALDVALSEAEVTDRVVVFGSFQVLAEVRARFTFNHQE